MTAVCWLLADAIGASTTGVGRVPFGLSPALQAVTPANASIKITADKRDNLDITNSFSASVQINSQGPALLESAQRQKLQAFDPISGQTT
jgi:hypothetical protein